MINCYVISSLVFSIEAFLKLKFRNYQIYQRTRECLNRMKKKKKLPYVLPNELNLSDDFMIFFHVWQRHVLFLPQAIIYIDTSVTHWTSSDYHLRIFCSAAYVFSFKSVFVCLSLPIDWQLNVSLNRLWCKYRNTPQKPNAFNAKYIY